MTKVAAIHTVQSVYASFPDLIRETIPGVEVVNIVDEFLASDPAVKGEFTTNNLNRLHAILRCAEMTEPNVIVVTCSTLTPSLEALRPLISTPILAIDGAMLRKAVTTGSTITILATAQSAIKPVKTSLTREGVRQGKTLNIDIIRCDAAFTAIKKMDKVTHDSEVLATAMTITGRDVIILAQASTAHLEEEIQKLTGIPTLSSPKLCMEELKQLVG